MAKRPSNPPAVKVEQPAQPQPSPAEPAPVITKDPALPPENPELVDENAPAIGRCIYALVRDRNGDLNVRPGIVTRVYSSPHGLIEPHVGAVIAMNPTGEETGTKDERAQVVSILNYDPALKDPNTYCWSKPALDSQGF